MTAVEELSWVEANQRHLTAALDLLRAMLEQHGPEEVPDRRMGARDILDDIEAQLLLPPAITRIQAQFGLSAFERDILLLCAAPELDASFGPLIAAANGDPRRDQPTFGLALALLDNAHWSALAPDGPLRRWRLVDVGIGNTLAGSPLRVDERVLHYLASVDYLDERLHGLVEPVQPTAQLVPSQQGTVERIVRAWQTGIQRSALPVLVLCGPDGADKAQVAASACATVGLRLQMMPAEALPTAVSDLVALARLWDREAALGGHALLLDCDSLDAVDPARARAVDLFVERVNGPLLIAARERRPFRRRLALVFDLGKPTSGEQRELWSTALGPAIERLNGRLDDVTAQFNLGSAAILAAGADALAGTPEDDDGEALAAALWDAGRAQARPRIEQLAQRLEPAAHWEDLVLPDAQVQTLREVALHVRQKGTVYDTWGFSGRGARGLGISALFAGASGTGKTMAAEVLANELRLDLYRIDLSALVSKYIGETEKNLRQVFDASDDGGAILLFDEADALFGKRSEVKDSHDRYANIEVSYLLQRMESYRGLAILTTNLKHHLDSAFLRRIRFVVNFPFPDAAQRAAIWRRIYPSATPLDGLDYDKLSRLNVSGGNIRNIALNSAFLAAGDGSPVRMEHVLHAARAEYGKLEKPLTASEIADWLPV